MRKLLELDDRFHGTGEPTVVVLARGTSRGTWSLEKTASEHSTSPAYEYIKGVTAKPGHTIVLVNALGAYEMYDDNRNGDGFPARAYRVGERAKCGHDGCSPHTKGWIADDETLIHHYKTFESHGGIYEHHRNKDASKSMGKVDAAFWHPRMQRVELMLDMDDKKAKDVVEKIAAGQYPAVSMGCHVKYDVCSVCGHRAPTRKDYCEHAKWSMRQIDKKTGEKTCVLNPSPRFFDISFVFRPADPTGFMLKKVAHDVPSLSSAELGERLDQYEYKRAEVRKLSDIQKEIVGGRIDATKNDEGLKLIRKYRDGMLPSAVKGMPKTTETELKEMAKHSFSVVASTLAAKNAALTTGDVIRLFSYKLAGHVPSKVHLDRAVALQPVIREVIASYPEIEEKLGSMVALSTQHVNADLTQKLGSWLEKRAGLMDYMRQRVHEPDFLGFDGSPVGPGYLYNATEPPKTDLLTMTDPNSGRTYQTTRGAAMAAHNTDTRAGLAGGAMLGGLYYLGLGRLGLNPMARAAIAGSAGLLSGHALMREANPYRNPEYVTDQGLHVSGGTEFVKASALSGFTVTGLLHKAALDYADQVGYAPDMESALRREMQAHSPKLAAWLYADATVETKAASLTDGLVTYGGPADPPSLDFAKFAERLGNLIIG